MHYSCFNPRTGLYDYWEDGIAGIPINGDLPVPSLPDETQLGVAAIEAGRKLPSSARPAGSGWRARGQIVQCGRGFNGLGADSSDAIDWLKKDGWKWILGGIAAIYIVRRL